MRFSDILRNLRGIFERKRKNPIQLERDSNLEPNLKFLKVDTKSTPIQISEDTVNVQGSLTVNGSTVISKLTDGDLVFNVTDGEVLFKDGTQTKAGFDLSSSRFIFYYDDTNYIRFSVLANGATILSTEDSDGTVGHLTLQPDGDLILDPVSQKTIINATDGLYFDGGVDTYIYEQSADTLRCVVGGDILLHIEEEGDDGNKILLGGATGFNQATAIFSTSAVIGDGNDSTDVDFRFTNKYKLELTNNISGSSEYINMIFPNVSGNFLLTVVQDGTGSRTVASAGWVAYAFDETLCNNVLGADGTDGAVRWAGGSAPTLTTTANKTDIISIYWDAVAQTAFAVPTLNF